MVRQRSRLQPLPKCSCEPLRWGFLSLGADMRRREFIAGLGVAAAVVGPHGALGQTKKLSKVGVLWHAGSAEEEAIYLSALGQGFASLGYIDGRNISLQHR